MKTLRSLLVAPFGACVVLSSVHFVHAAPPGILPLADAGGLPAVVRIEDEKEKDKENGPNLLTNASFEQRTTRWELVNWGKHSRMQVDPGEMHEGHMALRVENFEPCHSFVRQTLTGKAHTRYRLSGFIKTRDIEPSKHTETSGALLMAGRLAAYTPLLTGTKGWTKVSVEFTTTDDPTIRVGPSIGTDATFARGTAWFSDLQLVEVRDHDHDRNASAPNIHPLVSPFLLASERSGLR